MKRILTNVGRERFLGLGVRVGRCRFSSGVPASSSVLRFGMFKPSGRVSSGRMKKTKTILAAKNVDLVGSGFWAHNYFSAKSRLSLQGYSKSLLRRFAVSTSRARIEHANQNELGTLCTKRRKIGVSRDKYEGLQLTIALNLLKFCCQIPVQTSSTFPATCSISKKVSHSC